MIEPSGNTIESAAPPGWFACPRCRARALEVEGAGLRCSACGTRYARENGFLNLLADAADRFDDEAGCCDHANEEISNALTTRSYYLPLWRCLQAARGASAEAPLRILSAGCGVGVDVDLNCAHGVDAWGIDCGGRIAHWPQRREKARLLIANVKATPFVDGSFDVVKTDCLLPHVGVIGDSTQVVPDYREQRAAVARELLRIIRPGGLLIMANPNRRCPVDLFHKGQMRRSGALGRIHSRSERFLLDFDDYRDLFLAGAGATAIEALPIADYWNFGTLSKRPVGRILVPLLRAYFALLSLPGFAMLRRSAANPWLMVAVRK